MIWLVVVIILSLILFEYSYRGGIGWENLPEHINESHEWDGRDDDDHWYTKWKKAVKGLFAYHWTKKHWFGSLRKNPITLFATFGKGESRWENDFLAIRSINKPVLLYNPGRMGFYLSRIQYWCAWHVQIQWPIFICFHVKYGKTGVVMGYFGFKRDTDAWWFPSIFLGRGWK